MSSAPSVAVCTIADPAYGPGAGALVNSLVAAGFDREIWVRWTGDLPAWAAPAAFDETGTARRSLPGGAVLTFVRGGGPTNPARMKAAFLREVAARSDADTFVFFDADVVVLWDWAFFAGWLGAGRVAVCADCHDPFMPATHPRKRAWQTFAAARGYAWHDADGYYNAGFLGVPRARLDLLDLWHALTEAVEAEYGMTAVKAEGRPAWFPFANPDQDALNAALQIRDEPLAALGPNGMGFADFGANAMMHAIYNPKPWDRHYGLRSVVRGEAPTYADLAYWRFVETPLSVFPPREAARRRRAVRWATRAGFLLRNGFRDRIG